MDHTQEKKPPEPRQQDGRDAQGAGAADADALLRFGSTPDRMKAGVSRYVPARGSGRPLSVECLRKALVDTGITAPLDEKNAEEVVRLLLAGQDVSTVVVARGLRPRSAQDAWIEFADGLGFSADETAGGAEARLAQRPVFSGRVIGTLHSALPAQDGRDIAGNLVPVADPSPPQEISVADGIGLAPDGVLLAQRAGLVRLQRGLVELAPLFRVSPNKLEATATLYSHDCTGREVAPEDMVLALAGEGLTFGIQLESLIAGLVQARAQRKPVPGVVVALGQAPVHGAKGRLELLCVERGASAPQGENVRLDYRDQGLFPVAEQGADVARLVPPTKGVPGRDVFGAVIAARDGLALRVQLGKNVEAVDGGELFRAKIAGVVLAGKSSLDVSELLSIPGDVDYGTGNILLTQGSLRVGGTVRTGFTVQAPGKVLVEGMVESAHIHAGGDVIVRGGIFMSGDETASVVAGGCVAAAFTHHAQVRAGGDVTVALSIVGSKMNKGSRVSSGGFVRVTDPKGRIMGGTVVCATGLEVYDAGSERGLGTTLALNHETPEIGALVKEMRDLKAQRDRSVFVLGEGDGAVALTRLQAERRDEAQDLLAQREQVESRLRQIQNSLRDMAREHLERVATARIVVRGTIYPGVAIKMGGISLYVQQVMEHCVFSWDASRQQIVTGSL